MRPPCFLLLGLCVLVCCSSSSKSSHGSGSDDASVDSVQTGPCRFKGGAVHLTLDPNDVLILTKGSNNGLLNMNNQNCYGATTSNTRTILIDESAPGPQHVTLDFSAGFFALANATGGGITLNFGTDTDDVLELIFPTAASRAVLGSNGFNVNGDKYVDFHLMAIPPTVSVALGPNGDNFQAAGDAVTGDPFPEPLTVSGGNGNDILQGGANSDHLLGDGGADLLLAGVTSAVDIFEGGDGADTVSFALRAVPVQAGFDSYSQGDNLMDDIEVLVGGSGDDTLMGSPNVLVSKTLYGGPGDDVFLQGSAATPDSRDTMSGGAGNDTVDYTIRTVPVLVSLDGAANDGTGSEFDNVLSDVENIRSGSGSDTLWGNANNNTFFAGGGTNLIMGGPGNDIILQGQDGDAGSDVIDGGTGIDVIDYSSRTRPLTVTLDGATGSGDLGAGEGDIIQNMENVVGGMDNDMLIGNASNNWIRGMAGDDTLQGLAGDDLLEGGDGGNTLMCGPGNDVGLEGAATFDCELTG